MPKQDILLGVNFDQGVYTAENTNESRCFNRVMIGFIIFNVSVFYFTECRS